MTNPDVRGEKCPRCKTEMRRHVTGPEMAYCGKCDISFPPDSPVETAETTDAEIAFFLDESVEWYESGATESSARSARVLRAIKQRIQAGEAAEREENPYVVVECYDCGLAYGGEAWIECIVPADVWLEISPTGTEGGILCIACIARRLKRLGRDRVPVMLCGMEPIRAAGQEEAFNRGWNAAESHIAEMRARLTAAESREKLLADSLNAAGDRAAASESRVRELTEELQDVVKRTWHYYNQRIRDEYTVTDVKRPAAATPPLVEEQT